MSATFSSFLRRIAVRHAQRLTAALPVLPALAALPVAPPPLPNLDGRFGEKTVMELVERRPQTDDVLAGAAQTLAVLSEQRNALGSEDNSLIEEPSLAETLGQFGGAGAGRSF